MARWRSSSSLIDFCTETCRVSDECSSQLLLPSVFGAASILGGVPAVGALALMVGGGGFTAEGATVGAADGAGRGGGGAADGAGGGLVSFATGGSAAFA